MASILRARPAGADYRTAVHWDEEWVHDGYARRVRLYVLAGDGVGDKPYVPEVPTIARGPNGLPSVRLTLRLRRRPAIGEPALGPLIDQGSLTAVLATDLGLKAPYRPHFVRAVTCALAGAGPVSTSTTGAGSDARVTLCVPALTPDAAFDVWQALHGARSRFVVQTMYDLRGTGAPTGAASFEQPLDVVLAGIADGIDLSHVVELLAPTADGRGYEPLPPLVTATRERAAPRAPVRLPVVMAAHALVPATAAVAPRPAAPANAHMLIASDAAQPVAAAPHRINIALINHLEILPVATTPVFEHLPLVEDAAAPIFKDRAGPGSYWYPLVFTLKAPAPSDDPSASAFAFTFRRTGVNPGPPPRPALEATVRFVLESGMSAETAAALTQLNHPPASPLPLDGLSVTLDVPYMEHGAVQVQSFAARVEQAGATVTATVSLLDDAVRMAYGSLAYPADFQAQPATVRIAYTYRAYTLVPEGGLHLVAGGKIALLAGVVARPSLAIAAEATRAVAQPQYAIRAIGRDQPLDARFPCADYGAFYLEQTAQGTNRIGCTDALKLGEVALKLYDEIVDLRNARFRVFRSLTQPGMFLVSPSTYRIARFGRADGDKAFRPAAMLYSVVDPDPSKSACFLQATLQPDIPIDARIALETALAAQAPHNQAPVVRYLTELSYATAPIYQWVLPAGIATPSAQLLPDSFAVGVSTGMTNALLLINMIQQSGLNGAVMFAFEDGTTLQSALVLDTAFSGPWDSGPVDTVIAPGAVTLTNRIERAVSVFDLFVRAGAGVPQQLAVNATLAPGESKTVPAAGSPDAAYCACAVSPGPVTLDELDLFVEDVTTSVIFVNQVSLAAHNLKALSAEARLKGASHVDTLPDVSGASTTLTLTLPLTAYLDAQTLEYRITRTTTDGTAASTPWLEADLRQSGVISLTWDLVGS